MPQQVKALFVGLLCCSIVSVVGCSNVGNHSPAGFVGGVGNATDGRGDSVRNTINRGLAERPVVQIDAPNRTVTMRYEDVRTSANTRMNSAPFNITIPLGWTVNVQAYNQNTVSIVANRAGFNAWESRGQDGDSSGAGIAGRAGATGGPGVGPRQGGHAGGTAAGAAWSAGTLFGTSGRNAGRSDATAWTEAQTFRATREGSYVVIAVGQTRVAQTLSTITVSRTATSPSFSA